MDYDFIIYYHIIGTLINLITMAKHLRLLIIFSIIIFFFSACQKDTYQTFYAPTANAGTKQNIQLPVSSAALAGSGSSNNGGSITGYLWSLISGPNVPVIVNPGSATTTVKELTTGTYIFQFMVIDNLGYSGIARDTVLVIAGTVSSITLQPTNNANEIHLQGVGSVYNASDATSPELVAGAWTGSGYSFAQRGAFKFDLSSIPANATVISAKLTLYSNPTPINGNQGQGGNQNPNYGSNNSMFIQRITSNWTASNLTWQTQPTTETTNQITIAHTTSPILDLTDIDVTSLVSNMLTNGNYGFMIKLQNETPYNIRNFCSSKYADATKHPKLVVTYQ